jgi:hypothetical protein
LETEISDIIKAAAEIGGRLYLRPGYRMTLSLPADVRPSDAMSNEIRRLTPSLIAVLQSSLQHWIENIRIADSAEKVFAILDDFRPLPWKDDERAQMSKVYIRRLEVLNTMSGSTAL